MESCGPRWLMLLLLVASVASASLLDQQEEEEEEEAAVDPASTLACHRRLYSYRVTKTDDQGRLCWDVARVMSCWGRCDSNEIADWRFPYKRSHHPVCIHDSKVSREIILRHCQPDASPGTERYQVIEALSCRCTLCRSAEASCEGLRLRGARSGHR